MRDLPPPESLTSDCLTFLPSLTARDRNVHPERDGKQWKNIRPLTLTRQNKESLTLIRVFSRQYHHLQGNNSSLSVSLTEMLSIILLTGQKSFCIVAK